MLALVQWISMHSTRTPHDAMWCTLFCPALYLQYETSKLLYLMRVLELHSVTALFYKVAPYSQSSKQKLQHAHESCDTETRMRKLSFVVSQR